MKKSSYIVLVMLALTASLSYAGDVVYTLLPTDSGEYYVLIQNDTDSTVHVQSILIGFYNQKGKPIEKRNAPCTGNCTLRAHDKRDDFGPYKPPPDTEKVRVLNVQYSVE
jgi:hypothetical protein